MIIKDREKFIKKVMTSSLHEGMLAVLDVLIKLDDRVSLLESKRKVVKGRIGHA